MFAVPDRPLTPAARRILSVASELFYRRGINAVGVDTIAAEAGVTKKTLYDRFGSKDALIAAYLSARDEQWRAVVTEHLRRNHADPVDRAVAPFAVLGERDSVLTARQAARQPLDAAPRSVETP